MYRFILSLLSLTVLTWATNPGVKVQLNSNGINYAKGIGMQVLNKRVTGIAIPSISGTVISIVHYDVTSIKITSFNAPNSGASVSLQPSSNVALSVQSISGGVSANYKVKAGSGWFSVSKSGSITATISGASVSQSLSVTASGGHPQLSAGRCSANVGNVKVTFHGDLIDNILNDFSDTIVGYLKDKLNPIICDQLKNVITSDANKELSGIPTSISIGGGYNIDYSLTSNPIVQSSNIIIAMLGKIWYTGHQNDNGIPSAKPIATVNGNSMLCIAADPNSVLGSAFYAAMVSNALKVTVNAAELQKFGLPTSILKCNCGASGQCVGTYIPQIQTLCNGSGTVEVILTGNTVPTIVTNTTGAFMTLAGKVQALGQTPGQANKPLFTADLSASAVIPSPLTFTGWKLSFQFHITGATLKLDNSQVGNIDQQGLQQLWQLALLTVVEGELNKVASAGISLPQIPYVTVTNPSAGFGSNALSVCGSIQYNGPTMQYYHLD